MTTNRMRTAIRIEGVGDDSSTLGGVLFCLDAGFDSGTYQSIERVLIDIPETIETITNPLTGEVSSSGFDFSLRATDDVVDFLFQQQLLPRFNVRFPSNQGYGYIRISDADGNEVTSGLDGQLIWVGDQCMLLGGYEAAGSLGWEIDNRAVNGCVADYAIEGSGVYTANPYVKDRKINLLLHDESTGETSTVWRGFVTEIDFDGTLVNISCNDLISALGLAKVNRAAPILDGSGCKIGLVDYDSDVSLFGTFPTPNQATKLDPAPRWNVIQANDAMFASNGSGRTSALAGSSIPDDYTANAQEWDEVDEAYDVLYWDPSLDITTAPTIDLSYPYHPLTIALAILTSTNSTETGLFPQRGAYDVLQGRWGAGFSTDEIDVEQWESVIDSTPEYKVERLILGYDGEEIEVLDTVRTLLRPWGLFLRLAPDGRIGISQMRLASVADALDPVPAIYPKFMMSKAHRNTSAQVSAQIGETPFDDGFEVNISAAYGYGRSTAQRQAVFSDLEVSSIDCSQFVGRGRVEPFLYRYSRFCLLRMPILSAKTDQEITVGTFQQLENFESAIIPNPTGTGRIENESGAAIGFVVGSSYDIATGTSEITMLLTNYSANAIVHHRAPALSLVSVSGGSSPYTFTVDNDAFSSDDLSQILVGDELNLYDRRGVLKSSDLITVTAKGASSITATAPALPSVTAGDVLRVAPVDIYSNSSRVVDNPYAYFCDTAGMILGSVDNSEGVIYG